MHYYLLPTLLILFLSSLNAQVDSSYSDFGGVVYLDSFVVTASKKGFNAEDFIRLVREDESFYQAFQNLRKHSYQSKNDIHFFDKKGNKKSWYTSKSIQNSDGDCRTMKFFEESHGGKYYKRKRKYRYYTSKLYDKLFFTKKKICRSTEKKQNKKKGISKHIAELKKLIFKPGEEVDVPLIGKKMAIFNQKMIKYYDYSIQSKTYDDGQDCYVFTAKVKSAYEKRKQDKTVIKFLETYFNKSDFQVVARKYRLFYNGALFDFDVTMEIKLATVNNQYIPEYISYDGNWDVPTKKREIGQFKILFTEFE